jgi:sensor c-di-GMP phosphodiesterase-like protein
MICSHRRTAAQIGVLLLGIGLGIAAAFQIAQTLQLRAGQAALRDYADRTLNDGLRAAGEVEKVRNKVLSRALPFCSDAEVALMRDLIFNANYMYEIERIRDHKVICTAMLGRLPEPLAMPVPDLTPGKEHVSASAYVPISPNARGFIIERDGLAAVFNPKTVKYLDALPMRYSGLYFDWEKMTMLYGFGHPISLTGAEVAAQKLIERDGIYYLPRCKQPNSTCIVASEPRADMLARGPGFTAALLLSGTFAGGAIALVFILLYRKQVSMESQLRRAIRKDALTLVYQPVVTINSGKMIGAEALARWVDESGESVRPDIFIALAEEKGFVKEITARVVQRAIDELGDLLRSGTFRVTINITAQDLADPEFFASLNRSMARAKILPSAIGLELTERSIANEETVVHAIALLSQSGHTVYIDDFGTGYSSLSYLHSLDASTIKIDRSFTRTVGTDAVTASVVPQILEMAHQLRMAVVVEGIETVEQAEYFRKFGGAIQGQGWYYGKPVSAAKMHEIFPSPSNARELPAECPVLDPVTK